MGDQADILTEQGIDGLIAHKNGYCEDYCQYCYEEYEDEES
jgi:hypothetical protein